MVDVFSIHKNDFDEYQTLTKDFIKKTSRYSQIQDIVVFNKDIVKSQKISEMEAKKSYSKAYQKHLSGYCVGLDVKGLSIDSLEFSKILEHPKVSFFIAGAYGFENSFLSKCNKVISLSHMTFSHKIAKIVLFEQIFRGFCILNNHPYHKGSF
ncbi:LSU m3Psi1915 methyltransferase RlmH [hydrothermal vent metagenome]|uniref:LSU m3Psi1915 methyltransferase RlmH n=1 Tax=hydrothermal vent metagenome TaxID=652676 RepID=A0A3B1DRQ6_9ZZZZ